MLKDIIINLKKPDTWKIQLTTAINIFSSKDNDEERGMHSKSDKIEIMINDKESDNTEIMINDKADEVTEHTIEHTESHRRTHRITTKQISFYL